MNKNVMKVEDWLLAIGGVNWGLTLFNWNLVDMLDGALGGTKIVSGIVYGAVGLSGVHKIWTMLTK